MMPFDKKEGHRTTGEREHDMERIASLHIRGMTPTQIAKQLSIEENKRVTAEMVRHDLNKIRDGWLNSAIVSYDQAKAREVAHIDEVEKAAWEGWARSIRDQTTETSEEVDDTFGKGGDGDIEEEDGEENGSSEEDTISAAEEVLRRASIIGGGKKGSAYSRRKAVTKRVTQVGSSKFLQVIQWCIDQRCKIYGLHQPEKFQIDWKTKAIEAGFSESEANDQFENMVKVWADVISEKDKNPNQLPDFNNLDSSTEEDGYPDLSNTGDGEE